MNATTVIPLPLILGSWHEFYSLLGTASATMVGLLFVAASVASGAFPDRRAPLRVFLSASVVHFSSVLAASLVMLAPLRSDYVLAVLILACATVGLVYSCMAWRDTVHDALNASIDLEDRAWYVFLPVVAYVFELGAAIAIACQAADGCAALALAIGMLLVIGIHNAWDITVWMVTRRRD
ncbi:MAG TPA: hypothetical protein VGG99_26715 [Acetobacteraceae bacterium]